MALSNFDDLIARIRSSRRKTVAVVEAQDAHALEAVIRAADIVDAVLVGDGEKIRPVLESLGEKPGRFPIVPVPVGMHPSVCAARLIHEGKADFLMKGKIQTGDLLKGVLAPEAELRTGSLMSHIAMIELPNYHKLLCVTDGGMCIYPDLEKKKQIIKNVVNFFHLLGYEKPNVAVLCAVETVNPKMRETVDAAALKQMSLSGELPGCYVEGPVSYDLAMVPEISKIKGYSSPAVGEFDIIIAPEITAGNSLSKCMIYTCGGRMAGLILGCKVPIVLTSRSSSADEKYYSLALGAGVCQ